MKPAIHGRDHRPGGADPIPDLLGDLIEVDAVWGQISRLQTDATWSITSASVSVTTTLVPHLHITAESGVECDIVSSPTRIVIQQAGLYIVRSFLGDLDTGSDDYALSVAHGVNTTSAIWAPTAAHRRVLAGYARLNGMFIDHFEVGDYITQVVGQNSGTTKTKAYPANLIVARIPGSISSAVGLDVDGGSP